MRQVPTVAAKLGLNTRFQGEPACVEPFQKMALCASTSLSDAAVRGCCCCCKCSCHNAEHTSQSHICSAMPSVASRSAAASCAHFDTNEGVPFARNPSYNSCGDRHRHGCSKYVCEDCALNGRNGQRQHRVCRCSHCCICSCSTPSANRLAAVLRSNPYLSQLPMVGENTNEEQLAEAITQSGYPGKSFLRT